MNKIKIEQLDIPIIRSCNLNCDGCNTFSNHKNIKGLVNLDESIEWLTFWASKLEVNSVNLFGGEPLLHPQFADWATTCKKLFPKSIISVYTNGYYLDKLFDKINTLFTGILNHVYISIHTNQEPYLSTVFNSISKLENLITSYYSNQEGVKHAEWVEWLNEPEKFKRWNKFLVNSKEPFTLWTTVSEVHKGLWHTHYLGYGAMITPSYSYSAEYYEDNHKWCQVKNYVNLYKGSLYKCPPIAVLEHTLKTFKIHDNSEWSPYIQNYKALPMGSNDSDILNWFENHKKAERVCNMCAFKGPNWTKKEAKFHRLKANWNYNI